MPAHSKSEIARAFDKVKEALRNQYAIGCKPAEFKPDGTFRSIQIVPRAAGAVPSRLFRAAGRPGERVVCDGAVSELKFSD